MESKVDHFEGLTPEQRQERLRDEWRSVEKRGLTSIPCPACVLWTRARQQLAQESLARWYGTPHKDRIAIVGVGIDCINLCNEVLVDSGVVPRRPFPSYDLVEGQHSYSDR